MLPQKTHKEGQGKNNKKNPVTMNLRVLHGIGKQAGLNHEKLKERAELMFGVDSMSELSNNQILELANIITNPNPAIWFKASGTRGKATQKQLDYLQDLWVRNSHEQTKESLLNWLKNKRKQHNLSFPVDNPAWFNGREMYRVVSFLLNERW